VKNSCNKKFAISQEFVITKWLRCLLMISPWKIKQNSKRAEDLGSNPTGTQPEPKFDLRPNNCRSESCQKLSLLVEKLIYILCKLIFVPT